MATPSTNAPREISGETAYSGVPTHLLSVKHAFDPQQITQSNQPQLCIFFPIHIFGKGARGFGQWRGQVGERVSNIHYQLMLQMFCIMITHVGNGQREGLDKQYITWTPIPSARIPGTCCGYLLRVVFQTPATEVANYAESHVASTTHDDGKDTSGSRRRASKQVRITRATWLEASMCYAGHDDDRSTGYDSLCSDINKWSVFAVFTIRQACSNMALQGADPAWSSLAAYGIDGLIDFPEGGAATCHVLTPTQMHPADIAKKFMPHIIIPARFTIENDDGMAGGDDRGDDSEDDSNERRNKARRVMETINSSMPVNEERDLAALKKRISKMMQDAHAAANGDPRQEANLRRAAQVEALQLFMRDVLNDDSSSESSEALKALTKWYNTYLEQNANFRMPTPKMSNNVSRFADSLVREASMIEAIWAINTTHFELIHMRLAVLHVYWYSPFHVHTSCLGGPGAGKSKIMQTCTERLIPGTFREIGTETAKAKNVSGNKSDFMAEFYEDIPPQQLGISAGNNGNSQSIATSNTTDEAMLKYRLTKGRVKCSYKVVLDGQHLSIDIDALCNTVMICGMNSLLCQIPKPIASRFNNLQFMSKTRLDVYGNQVHVSSKFQADRHPHAERNRAHLIKRDQRNQMMHAIVGLCCYLGIMRMPDLEIAQTIWQKTLDLAKTKGLHDTDVIRNIERTRFHCEVLIVEDAIDRVFDSELQPFGPDIMRKWHINDILEVEKHLYANTEHASVALGLMEHQWENPIVHSIESLFRRLLKSKIAHKQIGKQGRTDSETIEMSDYYVIKTDNTSNGGSIFKMVTQLVASLADFCVAQMDPKPERIDVQSALQAMMSNKLTVHDPRSNSRRATRVISTLAFASDGSNDTMIAVELMSHYSDDRLKDCLRDVLTHSHTDRKNILFGQMLPGNTYVYQSMKIFPVPNKVMVMMEPNFHSSAVLANTQQLAQSVNASSTQPDSSLLTNEEVEMDNFGSRFSTSSHKDVTMDLDEYIAQKQAIALGLEFLPPTPDAPNFNTSMASFNDAIISQYTPHTLVTYPQYFKEIYTADYRAAHQNDQQENPRKYCLESSMPASLSAIADGAVSMDVDGAPPAAAAAAISGFRRFKVPESRFDEYCSDSELPRDNPSSDDDDDAAALPAAQHPMLNGLDSSDFLDSYDAFAGLDSAPRL